MRLTNILILVGLGLLLTAAACGKPKTTPSPAPSGSPAPTSQPSGSSNLNSATGTTTTSSVTTVSLGSGSFSPATVTVPRGSAVVFQNDDTQPHWVASDPHPIHTNLPGFDLGLIPAGTRQSFSFSQTGTFGYHDHLNTNVRGTVRVTE